MKMDEMDESGLMWMKKDESGQNGWMKVDKIDESEWKWSKADKSEWEGMKISAVQLLRSFFLYILMDNLILRWSIHESKSKPVQVNDIILPVMQVVVAAPKHEVDS